MILPAIFKNLIPLTTLRWAVLVFGLLFTTISSLENYRAQSLQKQMAFDSEKIKVQMKIRNRLELYENFLIEIRAFLLSDEKMTREKFHRYIRDTRFIEKNPGIQALAYVEKVDLHRLMSHVDGIKRSGFPEYKITPDTKRETYYPIVYVEPMDWRNKRVIGFDVFSEPVRREVLKIARDTGNATIAPKIRLLFEKEVDRSEGMVLFLPIYKPGADISNQESRRGALTGFLSCVFRSRDFFNSIFADSRLKVDFEIYYGKDLNSQSLLYDYDNEPLFVKKKFNPKFFKTQVFELYGKKLTLIVTSGRFSPGMRSLTFIWIFLGGLLLTFLITWIITLTIKQAENLLKVQAALEEAVIKRDEFLSIASHELRTPMTSLKLQSQILKRNVNKGEDLNTQKEKISSVTNQIVEQISSLNRLVEDMLDVTRLRSGKFKLELSECDLAEIIQNSVRDLSEQMSNNGYPEPQIEISGNLKGTWDKFRINQVISNILTNAIRYGNQKLIKIKGEELPDAVKISITDQGIGISEEDKERVFNRFERATSSSESSGLGLGLFISRQIINAHRGRIWVESKPGEGATFIFIIPKK